MIQEYIGLKDYVAPRINFFDTQNELLINSFRKRLIRETQGARVLFNSQSPLAETMIAVDAVRNVTAELAVFSELEQTIIVIRCDEEMKAERQEKTLFIKYPDLFYRDLNLKAVENTEEEIFLDVQAVFEVQTGLSLISRIERALVAMSGLWRSGQRINLIGIVPMEMILALQMISYQYTAELFWIPGRDNPDLKIKIF